MKLSLGAMCPKLSEQVPGLSDKWDKLADALTILNIHGILSESATFEARRKLIKGIEQEIKKGKVK